MDSTYLGRLADPLPDVDHAGARLYHHHVLGRGVPYDVEPKDNDVFMESDWKFYH